MVTICIASAVSFLGGFAVSGETGVEPGFFEAVETGGYGAGPGGGATEGISSEFEKYYQDLAKE